MVVPSIAELRQDLTHARSALDRILESVEHRLERMQALRERLRVPERLESRAQEVDELGRRITQAEDIFFTAREKGLADARAAIAAAPHRAMMALSEKERQLAEQRPRLAAAPERFQQVTLDISEESRRLSAGIARQLGDHERDYRRAVDRLISGIQTAALRRFRDELEQVVRAGRLVYERVVRRVEGAEREHRHVAALIAARDFRQRGFVLATDMEGRVVPSVAGLGVGTRLNLNFRDGRAEAAVDKIKEDKP
jgi:exonuclease VII large subunit